MAARARRSQLRLAVRASAVLLASLCLCACTKAAPERPNIVVILADDMGYGDIGVDGGTDIPTPNIDALAASGIRFTDAYVSSPYCSPSRAGLLTGRYQQRFGHEFNLLPIPSHADAGLPVDQRTIAERLQAVGYRTAIVGKWHLGSAERFHPLVRGFDEFYGFLSGQHSYLDAGPPTDPIYDGRTPVTTIPYLTDAFADRAVDFIKREKDHPFFLYLSFNAVHLPLQATPTYLARFDRIADPQRRTYAAMLSAMDDAIGKTLDALRTEGLDRKTLVFFVNDNGGPTVWSTGVNGSSNAPLRGSKRQTWEGGIRVPFFVRWTDRLPAGVVDHRPIIQLDVLPTALAAAGVAPDPAWNLDGVDLLPFLTGTRSDPPHDALYWRLGGMMAVREGDWKLVKSEEGAANTTDPSVLRDLSGAQLYDLAHDVEETNDLAAAHPDEVRKLGQDWQRWNATLAKPAWPAGRGSL